MCHSYAKTTFGIGMPRRWRIRACLRIRSKTVTATDSSITAPFSSVRRSARLSGTMSRLHKKLNSSSGETRTLGPLLRFGRCRSRRRLSTWMRCSRRAYQTRDTPTRWLLDIVAYKSSVKCRKQKPTLRLIPREAYAGAIFIIEILNVLNRWACLRFILLWKIVRKCSNSRYSLTEFLWLWSTLDLNALHLRQAIADLCGRNTFSRTLSVFDFLYN